MPGQQIRANHRTRRKHYATLYGILKLTHIARPIIVDEGAQCIWCERALRKLVLVGIVLKKMRGQKRDILPAATQRRKIDRNDI